MKKINIPFGNHITKITKFIEARTSQYARSFFNGDDMPVENSNAEIQNVQMFNLSTFFACIKVICEDISSLPFDLFKIVSQTDKEKDYNNYLFHLLKNVCNKDDMIAMDLIEVLVVNTLLWGNGYVKIIRNREGKPIELYPLLSSRMFININPSNGGVTYEYTQEDGKTIIFNKKNLINIPMFSTDGIRGKSIIQCARESLTLTYSAEEFGRKFFQNGTRLSGTIEMENGQKIKNKDETEKDFQKKFSGAGNVGKVMILEGGMKFNTIGIPPEDAQFLQTRQFQVEEVCRWFRMPPHKIGDLSKSTYSNIEQQNIDYISSINPLMRKIEKHFSNKLLENYTRFFKFDASKMLKGDFESRMKGYTLGVNNGVYTPNEVRAFENMNSLKDVGDKPIVNGNMISLKNAQNNNVNDGSNKKEAKKVF